MLSSLRIALLGAWSGSLISFALFGVYRAFTILPTYLAAEFLRGGFDGLDQAGVAAGGICVLLALPAARRRGQARELLRCLAPLAASACHAVSFSWVTPQIAALRATAGGTVGQLAAGDPGIARFQFLHQASRSLYLAAILLSLACLVWDLFATRPAGIGSRPHRP